MKARRKSTALILSALLLLSACGPTADNSATSSPAPEQTSVQTPTPASEPTQAPAPDPTPTQEPLPPFSEMLEEVLSEDGWSVSYWGIFPGSGPLQVKLSAVDSREQLRSILTALDWQEGQGEDRPLEDYRELDQWIVFHAAAGQLNVFPKIDTVNFSFEDETLGTITYHTNGTADLCRELLNLWPGPEVYYFRASPQEDGTPQAVAEQYAADFEAAYRGGGAITDFKLNSATGTMKGEGDEATIRVKLNFSVKPLEPDLEAWEGWGTSRASVDSSGWASYECTVTLGRIPDQDGWSYTDFQYE